LSDAVFAGREFGAGTRKCKAVTAATSRNGRISTGSHGHRACLASTVRVLCGVARLILIIAPIVTCAARIHAHVVDAPDAITQELNQCLRLVNVAASRRPTSTTPVRPWLARQTRMA
jgi:hypothetical protein